MTYITNVVSTNYKHTLESTSIKLGRATDINCETLPDV